MVNIPAATQSSVASPLHEPSPTSAATMTQSKSKSPDTPRGPLADLPVRKHRSFTDLRRESTASTEAADSAAVFTSEEVDSLVDQLTDFHGKEVLKLSDEVVSLRGDLQTLSSNLQTTLQQRDTRTAEQKAQAKNRAISRENKIASLTTDLDRAYQTISETGGQLSIAQHRLDLLTTALDGKSNAIKSRTNAIKAEKNKRLTLRDGYEQSLGEKDAQIADLQTRLEAAQSQIKALEREKSAMQGHRETVATTASGLTVARTKALVDSGRYIEKRATVLEALNKKLTEECNTLRQENSAHKNEIGALKTQVLRLAQALGIDLTKE